MTKTERIDAAMQKLQDDPQLAADFDESRKIDFPLATTRREACEAGLKAIEAKQLARLAQVRAKAMKYTANVAAKTFKKAVAAVAPLAPKFINSTTTTPDASTTPPDASTTPHLDQFEKLEGAAASHFYATHGAAIRAESGTRQHEKNSLEKEMNAARATARQMQDVKKYSR